MRSLMLTPAQFISKNINNTWFQTIVPTDCRLGATSIEEGECYIQFFIEGIDQSFHYEILFFTDKAGEDYSYLQRYEIGKVYVELHAEHKSAKRWKQKNGALLALLNDKLRPLSGAFVKEWVGDNDIQSNDTGFAFRPEEGFVYGKMGEEHLKECIARQLKNLAQICKPIIDEANRQARYPQWLFFLTGGELFIEALDVFRSKEKGEKQGMVEMLAGVRIVDLLVEEKISLPDYQRNYCWGKSQVEHLLESIWFFPWEDYSKSHEVIPKMHLGTIVLHEKTDSSGQLHYDIVDGQQRLITLSILFKLSKVKVVDKAKKELPYRLLAKRCMSGEFKWRMRNNAKRIGEWLVVSRQRDEDGGLKVDWLNNIQVDVIIVKGNERLGLVYTFFNAINSAGKKLTDYDLLKPHHLRYLEHDDPQEYFASEWDSFVQEKVPTFGNSETLLSEELMDTNLYRLRSWSRHRPISQEKRHVFNHFTAYSSIVTAKPFDQRVHEIDVGIGGGRPFFFYVMEFGDKYRDFVKTLAVAELHSFKAYWRHAVLLNVIRALLFQYYCKFGNVYLSDALVFIVERIGTIRAKETRIDPDRTLQDTIISDTVEALDESPSPEFFFGYCVLPTHRYVHDGMDDLSRTHIKPAFWIGVRDLINSLQGHFAFGDNARMRDIEKCYKQLDGK